MFIEPNHELETKAPLGAKWVTLLKELTVHHFKRIYKHFAPMGARKCEPAFGIQ
jgi:hypothetical protein